MKDNMEDESSAIRNAWREREKECLRRLEEITSHPKMEQERFLERVLKKNANAVYLQQFGLNGATDVQTFRQRVPVSDYSMVRPFVRRVLEGDRGPILARDPVVQFMLRNVREEPKIFPVTLEDRALRLELFHMTTATLNRDLLGLAKGKTAVFVHVKPPFVAECGLYIIGASSSFWTFEGFKRRPFNPSFNLTSPYDVMQSPDYVESMYCQLLCALYQRDEVLVVSSFFASALILVLQKMEEWWPEICDDIAGGTLSKTRVRNETVVAAMKPYQRADPQLADLVRQSCSQKSSKGIVRRLWPNCKAIDVISTGSMQQYLPVLRHLGDHLPIVCLQRYVASECNLGLSMMPLTPPEETAITLCPSLAYFEFIPVSAMNEAQRDEIFDLASVKEGETYEVLVTTVSGLCRNRLGDVVEVVGSYNASPSFRIVGRRNHLQPVDTEKVEERELYQAMGSCGELLRECMVVDFSSTVDVTGQPGFHVIYPELKHADEEVLELCADLLERCCCTIESTYNVVYRSLRWQGRIGPLELESLDQERSLASPKPQ